MVVFERRYLKPAFVTSSISGKDRGALLGHNPAKPGAIQIQFIRTVHVRGQAKLKE